MRFLRSAEKALLRVHTQIMIINFSLLNQKLRVDAMPL
jgi:hypothetical protein